jgi:hypothetical protein
MDGIIDPDNLEILGGRLRTVVISLLCFIALLASMGTG